MNWLKRAQEKFSEKRNLPTDNSDERNLTSLLAVDDPADLEKKSCNVSIGSAPIFVSQRTISGRRLYEVRSCVLGENSTPPDDKALRKALFDAARRAHQNVGLVEIALQSLGDWSAEDLWDVVGEPRLASAVLDLARFR